METRNILNNDNQVIGQLTLPDNTPEEVWQEKLNAYKAAITVDNSVYVKRTIKERKEFSEQMLEEFKAKNISEGINALQALKMQEKSKRIMFSFMGVDGEVDILNCAVSGDVEVACLALMYCTNLDDMSLPYHWLNTARRDWLVSKMKAYLGWA